MYILHYTWPKVMSAKQDESKEPEEPGVPRCARSVPAVPRCAHMCQSYHGCTTHVPRLYPWCSWQEMCQEGKRGSCSVLLLAQHTTRLSPQKSTQLEKPKTTANNSRGKTTKTYTPPRNLRKSQKNKRTVISKQAHRQKEFAGRERKISENI